MSSLYRKGVCSNSEQGYKQKFFTVKRGGAAFALLCSVGATGHAQDVPPGMIATFDITQRLEYSDNPDLDRDGDSDLFGRTILGFQLQSVTKVQAFTLNLGTDIEEFQGTNDEDINFTNSFATLNYDRNTRNALVGLNLRYRESDTNSDISDEEFDLDGNVINQDDGTRVSYGSTLEWAVGRDAPVGASFLWTYNEVNFKDTNDPDFNDSKLHDVSGQVNFLINPRITASLTGKYSDFDTDDPTGTDRETKGVGVAADLQISPILTSNIELSYDEIDRSGGTNRSDDGVSGSIGLTRDLTNGSIGVLYKSDVFANDDGRRSFLSVSRDMELPRGALFLSVGATGADGVGTDPLLEANYRHDLPTGEINIGLNQRVVVDEDDNEDLNTSLRASYDKQINSLSSYGFNLTFFNRNVLDGDGDDSQRYDIGFTYRRDLTRHWGLVSGISYTYVDEDNDDDRSRTTVFFGLERSFNWIP